jgi:cell division protein FtsZ
MSETTNFNLNFALSNEMGSIIKVIGVGGGGSNAVNHMYKQGIHGVDFIVCNTDAQALESSPVPVKFQLGYTLTEGRGAGSNPEKGRNAAIENIEEIKRLISNGTKMVFITAGMGGGTGTGAAPVIAAAAKELGILTVGIVTMPFMMEGVKRKQQAAEGIAELKKAVDTLIIISNDKLRELCGNLSVSAAFANADNVLTIAAKGIAEIITVTGYVNVDFADVQTVMSSGGTAIMGSATAEGENRALRAVEMALSSPLLNDNKITGAKHILINITGGEKEILLDEVGEIIDYVQEEAGKTANVIFGTGSDMTLGDKISVMLIATGFDSQEQNQERVVKKLDAITDEPTLKVPQLRSPLIHRQVEPAVMPAPDPDEELLVGRTEDNPLLQFEVRNVSEEEVERIEDGGNENLRMSKERANNLRNINVRLRPPQTVSEMESAPAYRRKGVKLDSVPHSSENNFSRFVLTENPANNSIEIRQENSFLHDNVD